MKTPGSLDISVAVADTQRTMELPPPRKPAARILGRTASIRFLANYGLVLIGALLIITGIIAVPGFSSSDNIATIMRNASCIGVAAIGMSFVVLCGHYADLSIAAQIGTAAVCVIALQPYGLLVAIIAALTACLAMGLINGAVIGYTNANAVVVTLGTGLLGLGLLNHTTHGALSAGQNPGFARFMSATLGPVPVLFMFLLAVVVTGYAALNKTSYGARIRAVGFNTAAAKIAGVRSERVVLSAFVVSGLCSAICGIMLGGFSNSASPSIAQTYVFDALAGIVVGGASLTGGRGGAGKTLVGVIIIAVIGNLLVLRGLPYAWNQLITGIIIAVAVGISAGLERFRGI